MAATEEAVRGAVEVERESQLKRRASALFTPEELKERFGFLFRRDGEGQRKCAKRIEAILRELETALDIAVRCEWPGDWRTYRELDRLQSFFRFICDCGENGLNPYEEFKKVATHSLWTESQGG